MCLAKVHDKNKKLSVGYKVMVKRDNGSLVGQFRKPYLPRPLGKWLHSDDYEPEGMIESHYSKPYRNGWHIYSKKCVAEKNLEHSGYSEESVVVRVRVRDIVASGTDFYYEEVVVAKQILITGEVQ